MAERRTRFTQDDIVVARVIHEDERFMLFEVAKSEDETFHLDDEATNNRFFSLIFTAGKPWEHDG